MSLESADQPSKSRRSHGLVFRNTFALLIAQAIVTPLSVLVNAVMGRYLGPGEFGHLYLAWTFCSFGLLLVDWGQSGTLPAMIARDRSVAGKLLGSAILWRCVSGAASAAVMVLIAVALGYDRDFLLILGIAILIALVTGIIGACLDTVRGFERTDITAYGSVGQQFLLVAIVIPTLLLGGGVQAVMLVQLAIGAVVLVAVLSVLGRVGVGQLRSDRGTIRQLLVQGSPFLFFGLAMVLQPNVDAVFLSRLAPPEVVGWHAAARRLLGVLITPAASLGSALYPTLCRLWVEDPSAYRQTVAKATHGALLIAVPASLGCALYPEIGISIFSKESFGPAIQNLRLLAPFLLLVYVSMPLGTALIAAGRQRLWACVQLLCVLVSAVLDPLLVPWFQAHYGNGGLGICVATVASEVFMVAVALWLTPSGVFDRSFLRRGAALLFAGGAMALVARGLSWLTPFLAAPVACATYLAVAWFSGGIDREYVVKAREFFARKFNRA